MTVLRRKSVVALLGLLGGLVVIVTGSRPWLTGSVNDAVLGSGTVTGTGQEVLPGIIAFGIVGGAAAVATTVVGTVARRVSLVALVVTILTVVALVIRSLGDATAVLGAIAARSAGRTGVLEVTARPTAWPWVALVGAGILAIAALGAILGTRRWGAPSARYERAETGVGARGERVTSAWEQLSAGQDPTEEESEHDHTG